MFQKASNDQIIDLLLALGKYEVKQDGTVWTRWNKNSTALLANNGLREIGTIDNDGYRIFAPRINGKKIKVKVHRLVYRYFHGELDSAKVVNHKDGNRQNNHPDNLELLDWVSNIKYRTKK